MWESTWKHVSKLKGKSYFNSHLFVQNSLGLRSPALPLRIFFWTSLVIQLLTLFLLGKSLIPGQGAKIPHASGPKNQNIKQKQYCNKFNKDFKDGSHKNIFKKDFLFLIWVLWGMHLTHESFIFYFQEENGRSKCSPCTCYFLKLPLV